MKTEKNVAQSNFKQNFKSGLSILRASFENFGRAILVPVTVIPLLALIGALGYAGQAIAVAAGTYSGGSKIAVDAIKNIGMIAISNIDFLVAVGLAAGLAKSEKIAAALSGLMAYAAIHFASNLMLQVVYPEMLKDPTQYGLATRFGVMSFQYSAFGGMIAGLTGFVIHKYTYKLKFPTWLSFFGGPRFSPVAATLVGFLIGMPLGVLWIYISQGLRSVGQSWAYLDAGAPFIYGFGNRLLIPFGLHQVVNYFLYYTEVGTTWTNPESGEIINGIYNVALAKLSIGEFITAKSVWNVNGGFPTFIFNLPAVAGAMYFLIPKENRKVAGSAIISAAMTSFLAGISEPIEFTFLFVSPMLYGIHAIFTGLTFVAMYLANFAQVSTRGSGIITWIVVNGINMKLIQNAWGIFIVGPISATIYFGTFYGLIWKLDIKTPGRDGKVAIMKTKKDVVGMKPKTIEVKTEDEYNAEFIQTIIDGVGGKDNIKIMANCITRLRVTVYDKTKVNQAMINETKPFGIKEIGDQFQIIYGPRVVNIATKVRQTLGIEE